MKRLILGCGFVGLRVGKIWSEQGDQVIGITRKTSRFQELRSWGIEPLLGDITQGDSLSDLPASDTVLVAVGMDRTVYSDIRHVYVEGLANVLQHVSPGLEQIIYVSSTGVYGDFDGAWVTEQSATRPSRVGGEACLEAESLIGCSSFSDRSTILRFAGIYGGSRVPMKTAISDRDWSKLNPAGHLNLIHVDDGVRIIAEVARRRLTGEVLNVSDGHPPVRREYYEEAAMLMGIGPIDWSEANASPSQRQRSDKRICNQKLIEFLQYDFQYPDFRSGLREALASVGRQSQ
jgi:nucleoside-diphosphate-sugar epimerase